VCWVATITGLLACKCCARCRKTDEEKSEWSNIRQNAGVQRECLRRVVQLMENLDWPTARDELTAAVDYLAQNGKKVSQPLQCIFATPNSLFLAQHGKKVGEVAWEDPARQ